MYDPADFQLFPKCPFLYFTGYQCPGCGSQRAVHALLHLNFKEAFDYNALLTILIPYMFAGLIFDFEKIKRQYPKLRNILFGQTAAIIVLVAVVLFFIFRNI